MKRLYQQIYLTVIASLVMTVIAASLVWHFSVRDRLEGNAFSVASQLIHTALAPVDAPLAQQQLAVEKLAKNIEVDISLYAADRSLIAAWGDPLPKPSLKRTKSDWFRIHGVRGWMILLPDQRWLVSKFPRRSERPVYAIFAFLATIAVVVALSAYPLVRRITGRLERLQTGVERLGEGDVTSRVKVEGKDEIAALAEGFNVASGKIEALLSAHRELLAHASHELRTPLARLRLGLELIKGDQDPKRKAAMEVDIAELDALVDEILLMSRLDNKATPMAVERLDLLAIAHEEAARVDGFVVSGESLFVEGNAKLLRRAIRNLLENARLHGKPSFKMTISHSDDQAILRVCDQGNGIKAEEWEKIFAPFYRSPGNQGIPGSGLGLPLVRQIAENHGGSAEVVDSRKGMHCVSIMIPLACV